MSKIEDFRKVGMEQESYSVQTTEELSVLIDALHRTNRVKGIGFDVFGTVLTSLYTRSELTAFLSTKIVEYLNTQTNEIIIDNESVIKYYNSIRETIKNGNEQLNLDVPAKQRECSETEALKTFGRTFKLKNIKGFVNCIQEDWLKFDLQNTRPIQGMSDVITKAIEIFGEEHVGLFSNNSCSKNHLLYLLRQNGYLENNILNTENVCVSSEFSVQKHGIGIRKPNKIAFKDFVTRLNLQPKEVAFVGDGGNDVLFATESGGVGIRFIF